MAELDAHGQTKYPLASADGVPKIRFVASPVFQLPFLWEYTLKGVPSVPQEVAVASSISQK